LRYARGAFALALDDYNKAIAINPIAGHYLNRGQVYLATGQYDLALSDFEKAAELAPFAGAPLAQMCRTKVLMGVDLAISKKDCDTAINSTSITVKSFTSQINRAMVEVRLNDFAAAIKDASDALASTDPHMAVLDPGFAGKADALYLRGIAECKLGDIAAGQADMAAAVKFDSGVAVTYEKAGIKADQPPPIGGLR
jgi:tetratricopeptide (TPR) repeat protein